MNIYEKLQKVQQSLKAPKGQFNAFGKYKYRSCEDILEAVKPLLDGCVITLSDRIEMIGDRYYVKATASFVSTDAADDGFPSVVVCAYAREEADKKGMDGSQITGAASSYARKYALNGLLQIDDAKDSDATNQHGQEKLAPSKEPLPKVDGMGNDLPDVPDVETNPEDTLTVENPLYKEIWQKIKDTPELDHEEFVAFLISYKSGVDGQGHPRRPLLTLPEFTTMKVSDAEYLTKNWNRCYSMFLKSKIEKAV
jgi:hypothetical protein